MNDTRLIEKSISFYEKTFSNSDAGRDFLYSLHIKDSSVFSKFRIGFSDGSMLSALPEKGRIIDDLHKLGILNKGKEFFLNCLTLPVFDLDMNIVNIAGIDVKTKKEKFLFDDRCKAFNLPVANTYSEIYRTENITDLLTLEMSGVHNSIAGCGEIPDQEITITVTGGDLNRIFRKHGQDGVHKKLSALKSGNTGKNSNDDVELTDTGFKFESRLKKYEIIGLVKKPRTLRATVRVEKSGKLHVDTIDFYSSKQRHQLSREICCTFEELPEKVDAEISKILRICEGTSAHLNGAASASPEAQSPAMTPKEREEALEYGKNPNLVETLLSDYECCGLIGEESNKLLCYLAMTSRKMKEPLSVLILSSSGAGKSTLQDVALSFCPPEDLVKLTNLSGKALFYKEKSSLKHKVLAIEEGAGAEDASYAIRNLISSDRLTSEIAVRDSTSGKLTTMTNTVEGPLSVFCTTTNPDVDPETRSRFLVTGVDESREQTRRILDFQRRRHSLNGLEVNLERERVLALHRNFQRLLKPLAVVNPFIEKLSYSDDRLQGRRAQPQYLNIIRAVAFLRQFQKECKECKHSLTTGSTSGTTKPAEALRYIEVDEKDIEIGNKLAVEILGKTLDELSIPARDLLELIVEFVEKKMCELRRKDSELLIKKEEIQFTRRELREFTGWTNTRLHNHLKELVDMENVIMTGGCRNSLQTYKLIYDGEGKDGEKFIPGIKQEKHS